MSAAYQFVDVVVAMILAFLTLVVFSTVFPAFAFTMPTIVACTYYFSRNPWGSPKGEEYNERIDEIYDQWLPF